jgi:hypothetical protein
MSLINGDKSRAGRQRKTRFEKRERNRILRQSLTTQSAQPAAAASPAVVVSPVVVPSAVLAAVVVAAAIPVVVAATIKAKKLPVKEK